MSVADKIAEFLAGEAEYDQLALLREARDELSKSRSADPLRALVEAKIADMRKRADGAHPLDYRVLTETASDLEAMLGAAVVPNVAMAHHWIDRYASGVDDEVQMDRIFEALGLVEQQPAAALSQAGVVGGAPAVVVDEAMVERALNAQPFSASHNEATRVYQLMAIRDGTTETVVMRAAIAAAMGQGVRRG